MQRGESLMEMVVSPGDAELALVSRAMKEGKRRSALVLVLRLRQLYAAFEHTGTALYNKEGTFLAESKKDQNMGKCGVKINDDEFVDGKLTPKTRLCGYYISEGEELCDAHLLQKYNLISVLIFSGQDAGMAESLYRERDVVKALRRAEFRK